MRSARLGLFAVALGTLLGCGVPGVPKPPSLDLPRPVTDLSAVRKGERVYLSWTEPTENTDSLPIRGAISTVVCRDPEAMSPGCAGGALESPNWQYAHPNGPKTGTPLRREFSDELPPKLLGNDPRSRVFYAVSILNQRSREAGISNVVSVPALASLAPPEHFGAEVTTDGVVLTWVEIHSAPDIPHVTRLYRVYRRDEKTNQDTIAGELPFDSSAPRLLDSTFAWEKTYLYRITVVTAIEIAGQPETQFEGDDSPPVRVFAHDIFPPAVPSDLQAVFSGAGQQPFIDLIWAPDTEADLAGYNVYRHEESNEPVKINSSPTKSPAFRDSNVASGHIYTYSVSAVDIRGNESARSSETSERVP